MGNTFAGANCCAPDLRKSGDYDGKDGAGFLRPGALPPTASVIVAGRTVGVAYTEWEEIIALSRAITPGGKLLGLSSTKKMLCTLHRSFNSDDVGPGGAGADDVSAAGLTLGEGEDEDHIIKIWEVNRVSVKPFLAARSGEPATVKAEDGGGFGGRNDNVSSPAAGDAGESVGKPKISEIASLILPFGVKVHEIAFLDSANPQFVVGSVQIDRDSGAAGDTACLPRHELWVWILQPVRRGFKHIVKETMRQRRQGDAAGNELASHGDARDRMPRSKSADDFSEMERTRGRTEADGGLGLESLGHGRGGGGINSNSKQHKLYLHRVYVVPLRAGNDQILSPVEQQPAIDPAGRAGAASVIHPPEVSAPSSSTPSRVTAIATLRDFLFAGDKDGRIYGWLWTNWYQADWRRVNRRRRRASQATKKGPLTPVMRPLTIVGVGAAEPAEPVSIAGQPSGSGRFATTTARDSKTAMASVQHPGGVTCLHSSHARSGMELYSAGCDDAVRIWSVDDVQGIVLMHTIDLRLYGMHNPCCLNVSQTPDVGAAWYAASHGFHAAPTSTRVELASNPMEAKRLKRMRGSRNTLPPKIFVAGDRLQMAPGSSSSSSSDTADENDEIAEDGGGVGSARPDGDLSCFSPAETDMSGEDFISDRNRHMVQGFALSSVRGDGKGRMEKAGACYLGHSAPITTLSYGPYNNGPLMSMCAKGEIKIWPTTMEEGAVQRRGDIGGDQLATTVKHATATYSSWAEDSNSVEMKGQGRLPIYASAVQPNDHVWAVGTEHIRAWALV